MSDYRKRLPQCDGGLFITDGGIETSLIFHDGFDLPEFAAFTLLHDERGVQALERYYRSYADIAAAYGAGFVFESATWRASVDWAARIGWSVPALERVNRASIELLCRLEAEYAGRIPCRVISGCIGPRGDGYNPSTHMSAHEAEDYHSHQARIFAGTDADQITAVTMTYAAEAIGITRAAGAAGMPVVISFTTETDGRLPDGQPLGEAIDEVDDATGARPAYYMINCAHPTHFADSLAAGDPRWTRRIRGLRANASCLSHAELDDAEALDSGYPAEFGEQHAALRARHSQINVFGGCCGTDARHVDETCRSLMRYTRAA